MYEAFIDLDELVLLCRDKHSKKFIKEAITCYRAGAFRSCIVSTWNAVVFDFIHKLQELELVGETKAVEKLKIFEKLRADKKYKELWDFELNIPQSAREDFELISHLEESDIKRLLEDRSRCAHPSMTSLEEPFEATAELARYHLRSAVTHLLQRPPVQGRLAKERIFADIKSEYFPVDVNLAVKHFEQSPLRRARHMLIQDIVIGLTKSLLKDDFSQDERKRQFTALNAVLIMYPAQMQSILKEKLSELIIAKVEDTNIDKVIYYLANINAWENLIEPCRIKLETFINKLELFIFDEKSGDGDFDRQNINILVKAIRIPFLEQAVVSKFDFPFSMLMELRKLCNDDLIDKIILPILIDRLHEASLKELISLRTKKDIFNEEQIDFHLIKKFRNASLKELICLTSFEESNLDNFVSSQIRAKIADATLIQLFYAASIMLFELKDLSKESKNFGFEQTLEEVNKIIPNRIAGVAFDELMKLAKKYNYNEHLYEFIKRELMNNIDAVVEEFESSSSYENARMNSSLLIDMFESLTDLHWNKIHIAFIRNRQIHDSCARIFCELFEKSVKNGAEELSRYWLIFRGNLNQVKSEDITILKKTIDSHFDSKEM